MASPHSLSLLHKPLFLSLPSSLSSSKPTLTLPPLFPKLPFPSLKTPSPIFPRASHQNDAVLEIISTFDGSDNKALPAVRTYENELTRLTVVGAVDFNQALTAAAADGGEAADEHIVNGSPAMVVETLFPGGGDEKSTVSTRLVTTVVLSIWRPIG